MNYAEVAVNFPGSRSTFCYAVPPELNIAAGQAVWVPFGSREVQGIVVELSAQPSIESTKEIAEVISTYPLLSAVQIELAQWISKHYVSSLFEALALMLPPGFERKPITCFQPANLEQDLSPLTPEQRQVLYLIEKDGKTSLKELERKFGVKKAKRIIEQLLHHRLIIKGQELEKAKVKAKKIPQVKLVAERADIASEVARLNKSRAHKQAAVLQFLSEQTQPIPIIEVRKGLNCSLEAIKALAGRHLISIELVSVRRDPLSHLKLTPAPPPVLTSSQQNVWESIQHVIAVSQSKVTASEAKQPHNEGEVKQPPVFLLFGVTGSGKTEIYLRALAQTIARGKRGICLIPEIALTPQTVERFASRFPGRVAVLHSGLSLGEQFDEWQRIREGECDVVIGPRSALFAPQPDLGLIVIEEEHEWT